MSCQPWLRTHDGRDVGDPGWARRGAELRMQQHFQMLDREDDFVPVAGRFVLLHTVDGGPAYCTSWDTIEEVREACFPVEPGFLLEDTLTGVFWTCKGMFK